MNSNHPMFHKKGKEIETSIRKNFMSDKDTKEPASKAPSKKSSSEKYDSYFSPYSSSEKLTNEADTQKKIAHRKKEVKLDDLFHQENEVVSSDVVEENDEIRKMMSMSLDKTKISKKVIEFTNVFM